MARMTHQGRLVRFWFPLALTLPLAFVLASCLSESVAVKADSDADSSSPPALKKSLRRRPETDKNAECLLRTLDGAFIQSVFAERSPKTGLALREALTLAILEESEAGGIDPMAILGLIHAESRFDIEARSPAGARGLVQMQPITARHMAAQEFLDLSEDEIASDPELQLRLGIRYLVSLKKRFQTLEKALIAYNAGPTKLQRLISKNSPLDAYLGYPKSVMKNAARFRRLRGEFAAARGGEGAFRLSCSP